jgi:hypothetical protein
MIRCLSNRYEVRASPRYGGVFAHFLPLPLQGHPYLQWTLASQLRAIKACIYHYPESASSTINSPTVR